MATGAFSGTNLLLRANRARRDPDKRIRPFDLWRLADGAVANASARQALYRHALVHAGLLVDPETELPYPACPFCDEKLDG